MITGTRHPNGRRFQAPANPLRAIDVHMRPPQEERFRWRAGAYRAGLCALVSLALPAASAAGLGALTAHSALGEPLQATVVLLGGEDIAGAHCFALTANTDREVLEAQPYLYLTQRAGAPELVLETVRPIKAPALEIGLRLHGCGVELERTYVLLLSPRSLIQPPAYAPFVRAKPPAPSHAAPAAMPPPRPTPAPARPAAAPAASRPPALLSSAATPTQPPPAPPAASALLPADIPSVASPPPHPATAPPAPPPTAPPAKAAARTPAALPLWLWAGGALSALTVVFFLFWGFWRRRAHAPKPTQSPPAPAMPATAPPLATRIEARVLDFTREPSVVQAAQSGSAIGIEMHEAEDAPAPPASMPAFDMTQSAPPQDDGEHDYQQTMQLAEVMLAYGRALEAAHLLQAHVEKYPHRSLESWLYLMQFYRQAGERAAFEACGNAMRQHFNAAPPRWEELAEAAMQSTQSLTDMPHILAHLSRLWPQPEASAYIDHLLRNNRGGNRQGFPLAILRELLLLRAILKQRALA